MKIVVLVAMDKELMLLLRLMQNLTEINIDGSRYYIGELRGNKILAGKCGIGKVNSALHTYKIIDLLKPDIVINSGVAGGVDGSLGVGSVLVADKVAYHDVWCGPGTKYGAPDGFDVYFPCDDNFLKIARKLYSDDSNVNYGLICSGDRFIHQAEEVSSIKDKFPEAKAVDMESASIAHTCKMLNTPFAAIRIMSDTPGQCENVEQYKNFWTEAPEKTFHFLEKILFSLCDQVR